MGCLSAAVGNSAVPTSSLGTACDYNGALKLSIDGRIFGCVGSLWREVYGTVAKRSATSSVVPASRLGSSCDYNGILKKSSTGEIFNCEGGLWQKVSVGGVPAGAIQAFNLSVCPSGWKIANGAGGTPNLRGRFVRGLGEPGRGLGSYQADMLKKHRHSTPIGLVGGWGIPWYNWANPANMSQKWSSVSGFAGGAETRPKNIALLYCQKK